MSSIFDLHDCPLCEGDGGIVTSCCGDVLENTEECDLCPSCGEHCGDGDWNECELCFGEGTVNNETMEEYIAEQLGLRIKQEQRFRELNPDVAAMMKNFSYLTLLRNTYYHTGVLFIDNPTDGATLKPQEEYDNRNRKLQNHQIHMSRRLLDFQSKKG